MCGFVLFALLAFLHSVISSLFLPKIRGKGNAPPPPCLRSAIEDVCSHGVIACNIIMSLVNAVDKVK